MNSRLQEQFEEFDKANPHVYRQLVELAKQWKAAGHSKCSIDMLFHHLRWKYGIRTNREYGINTKSLDKFKLNDHHTSRYARKIMDENPELAGLFDTRKQKDGEQQ